MQFCQMYPAKTPGQNGLETLFRPGEYAYYTNQSVISEEAASSVFAPGSGPTAYS